MSETSDSDWKARLDAIEDSERIHAENDAATDALNQQARELYDAFEAVCVSDETLCREIGDEVPWQMVQRTDGGPPDQVLNFSQNQVKRIDAELCRRIRVLADVLRKFDCITFLKTDQSTNISVAIVLAADADESDDVLSAEFRKRRRAFMGGIDKLRKKVINGWRQRETCQPVTSDPVASQTTEDDEKAETDSISKVQEPVSKGRSETASAASRPKRSTERGEAEHKLISALTEHHDYASGRSLKMEPINNNELALNAHVGNGSASRFFKKWFRGHRQYKTMCLRNRSKLDDTLKSMNREYVPTHEPTYGHATPGEIDGE